MRIGLGEKRCQKDLKSKKRATSSSVLATITTIDMLAAFDSKNQTWDEYKEILEQFFAANEIVNIDRQKAILIRVSAQTSRKINPSKSLYA